MNEALWYYYLSINAKEMSIQQNQWEKQPVQLNEPFMEHERKEKVNKGMSKDEYYQFAQSFFNDCLEISKKKNADYTGVNQDPFANFKSIESLGISTEVGFLTRMMDKMSRIASFVSKGELEVKDESVKDTLKDLSNYACLLAGYIESKKDEVERTNG